LVAGFCLPDSYKLVDAPGCRRGSTSGCNIYCSLPGDKNGGCESCQKPENGMILRSLAKFRMIEVYRLVEGKKLRMSSAFEKNYNEHKVQER
jgi:hypothetical protein